MRLRGVRPSGLLLPAILIAACQPEPAPGERVSAAGEPVYGPYTNLQVLAPTITWPVLEAAMLANLRGLGLRRTGGEGCLHCHVGSMDRPMETWDFAVDAKTAKRRARVMMRLVQDINARHLPALEGRDSTATVTCFTCHRGRVDPRPLPTVLERQRDSSGMDAVERTYRTLREAYYGAGVYDFEGALVDFGVTLADRGAYDDAVRALRLNVEFAPDAPDAHRWLIRILMEQAVLTRAVDDLRPLYDSLAGVARPEGAAVWYTLRSVGVRLRNAGALAPAAAVFALNEALYPGDHRVVVDLAQTRLLLGDTTGAAAGARRALAIEPGYAAALELLEELGLQ